MELLLTVGIVLVSSLAVWKGGGLLESSSEALATHYRLPPVVRGSIIMAVGSSFPELSTTVISTLIHGKFDLGVSAIVGSAIFNILVIPGLSAILAGKLEADRTLIHKDAQFYMTSVALLLAVFSLAVIYHPAPDRVLTGTLDRWLALIPVGFYLLYLFLQAHETRDYRNAETDSRRLEQIWKHWLKLIVSLGLIVLAVEGLVRSAIFFGETFGTPDVLWGVTVIAAATSVPDALVSIRVARHGKGLESLSNAFGSNTFDLLVAVPAGVLIAGAAQVDFAVAVPMMFFLVVATITLIVLLRRRLELKAAEGWFLLALYAGFITWMILESFGITSLAFG